MDGCRRRRSCRPQALAHPRNGRRCYETPTPHALRIQSTTITTPLSLCTVALLAPLLCTLFGHEHQTYPMSPFQRLLKASDLPSLRTIVGRFEPSICKWGDDGVCSKGRRPDGDRRQIHKKGVPRLSDDGPQPGRSRLPYPPLPFTSTSHTI